MTLQSLAQILASGLLMGLIYALIAAGLSLIFGLMDVVNFAHGEFLMLAMYATFGIVVATALDPVLASPLVVGAMFVVGAFVYLAVIRFAMRARTNVGMVQVFATFGLGITIRGLAQHVFTPDYRSIQTSFLSGRTLDLGGVFLPLPQLFGGVLSCVSFVVLYFIIRRTDFGRALEATREDAGAVALAGIDKNRVFALGWGLGAALVGLAGAVMAIFFYIYPDVGASFALVAYVTVALGGFGSVFGAFAGGIVVGLVEAATALMLPPSLKSLGIYAVYLLVVFLRPRGLFGSL
ncbi:MAG: branched-chain amino acid ABC transporter permease [Hyphomicrobiales bacterium]|nr:branched-chain amino acid ABC transporter permease [Hyphomicrobiales bacterium]